MAIHRVTPTVLDLWWSIGSVSWFLMCFSACTVTLVGSLGSSGMLGVVVMACRSRQLFRIGGPDCFAGYLNHFG